LENNKYAKKGEPEYAGAIYSEGGKNNRTYSYNGSYTLGKPNNADYHEKDKPTGSRLEGYIHTHNKDVGFSKHETQDDIGQYLDHDFMTETYNVDLDFYLVNPDGSLEVSRRRPDVHTSDMSRGKDYIMATGLGGTVDVKSNVWLGPDNKPISQSDLPAIKAIWQKYGHSQ
jgi:hypothetical protein